MPTLGLEPGNQTQQVLTVQPLIPFAVSPTWSIITRTILPFISQPGLAPGEDRDSRRWGHAIFGISYLPARTGSLVWGIGPVFQLPTATNVTLGQGKWGAGPIAGVQWSGVQWTFGALINNIWSFAGDTNRPAVNQMQLQPEVNYNFKRQSESLPELLADYHCELASERRRTLDGADLSGHRSARENWPPVRQLTGNGLLQCGGAN